MRLAPLLLTLAAACSPAADAGDSLRGDSGPAPVARDVRVIDGDTVVIDGETIRLLNIDAPEMPPRAGCWAEARLAWEAKRQLTDLAGTAPGLAIRREGTDRYGRTLAYVSFNGWSDAGETMIALGLASPWTGRRWDWCGEVTASEDGARILRDPEDGLIEAVTEPVAPAQP